MPIYKNNFYKCKRMVMNNKLMKLYNFNNKQKKNKH